PSDLRSPPSLEEPRRPRPEALPEPARPLPHPCPHPPDPPAGGGRRRCHRSPVTVVSTRTVRIPPSLESAPMRRIAPSSPISETAPRRSASIDGVDKEPRSPGAQEPASLWARPLPEIRRWATFRGPIVLAVARTLTSAIRLLDALTVAFRGDQHRVRVLFTFDGGSAFSSRTLRMLQELGGTVVPWDEAPLVPASLTVTAREHVDLD